MDINRKNFEAYLLDYEEGNLTLDERKQVESFMRDNQDLASSVDFFDDLISFNNQRPGISKKELIKDINQKKITVKNVEEHIIADLEGDLSRKKSGDLELFIEDHPFLRKDYILYSKSFLNPPRGVFYPNKNELTRKNEKPFVKRINPWLAMVGSVLLLVGLYIFSSRFSMNTEVEKNVAINDVTHPAHVNPVTKVPEAKDEDNPLEKKTYEPATKSEKPTGLKPEKPTGKKKSSEEEEKMDTSSEKKIENKIITPITSFEFHVIALNIPPRELHPVNKYYLNPERENAPATEYKTIPRFLLTKVNDFLFPEDNAPLIGENASNGILWALADVGIKGVNKITDKEITLNRQVNPEGKITNISLESERFEIARAKSH